MSSKNMQKYLQDLKDTKMKKPPRTKQEQSHKTSENKTEKQ